MTNQTKIDQLAEKMEYHQERYDYYASVGNKEGMEYQENKMKYLDERIAELENME